MSHSSRRLIAVPLLLLHAAAALLGDGLHSVLHCEHHHVAQSSCTSGDAALRHECACSHSHTVAERTTGPIETRELSSAHHCVVCDWLAQLSHAVAFCIALPQVERTDFAAIATLQDAPVAPAVAQPARGPPAPAAREA